MEDRYEKPARLYPNAIDRLERIVELEDEVERLKKIAGEHAEYAQDWKEIAEQALDKNTSKCS